MERKLSSNTSLKDLWALDFPSQMTPFAIEQAIEGSEKFNVAVVGEI